MEREKERERERGRVKCKKKKKKKKKVGKVESEPAWFTPPPLHLCIQFHFPFQLFSSLTARSKWRPVRAAEVKYRYHNVQSLFLPLK